MNQPQAKLAKRLSRRLSKGQRAAFVELYDDIGQRLYRYLTTRLGSPHAASDVLQNVFERLVRYHRQFGKVQNINGYVYQVARNESIRWLEKNGTVADVTKEPEAGYIAEMQLDQDESIQHLLTGLEMEDREIVSLKVFGEMTFAEIAEVLRMPGATVATRYRRAIKKLERQLSKEHTK